ncbi:MAG: cell division protein [Herbaspirillum sp.]|nr:cell division protein [Herbaspirillum sp.]
MWMYGVVIGHLIVGILLPWIGALPVLDVYHRIVEAGFWPDTAPLAARQQQIWWISLFGPTIQCMSLWMGVLVYIGDRQRSALVWTWLAIGVVVWGPQDMLISLRAGAWIHVWIDCFAMATMLPPLFWLWRHDRRAVPSTDQTAQATA